MRRLYIEIVFKIKFFLRLNLGGGAILNTELEAAQITGKCSKTFSVS